MNSFDIIVSIIFGFCLIRGIFRGLVKELSSIIGVMAGYFAAYSYYPYIAKFLSQWISVVAYSKIIGFLVVFIGVFLIISILGVIIKYLMSIAFLGWADRVSGGIFGLIKGLLIVSILFIVFTTFLSKNASIVKDSVIAPHLSHISTQMAKIMKQDMKQEFTEKIEGLNKAWKKP
jgi:membrane protein required for colicin V production